MTNTDSRGAIELDMLPSWEDADALDHDDEQRVERDRQLAVYGFDSEQRTLVGLGPVERARRSRSRTSAPPPSERMPQSEPPGPFIAEDEAPPSARSRKRAARLAALPAVLVAAASVLLLARGMGPSRPVPSRLGHAAALSPKLAPLVAKSEAAAQAAKPSEAAESSDSAPLDSAEPTTSGEAASTDASTASKTPAEAVALPVKLPELSTPTVVDRSSGAEANIGMINVTSNPPANVVLDGRPLGKAPRVVKVPAGKHTLVFIHPLYGRRSVNVNVRSGVTTGASADF